MTAESLRSLKARLEATLTRPQKLAVPVDVDDVRSVIRLITMELISREDA